MTDENRKEHKQRYNDLFNYYCDNFEIGYGTDSSFEKAVEIITSGDHKRVNFVSFSDLRVLLLCGEEGGHTQAILRNGIDEEDVLHCGGFYITQKSFVVTFRSGYGLSRIDHHAFFRKDEESIRKQIDHYASMDAIDKRLHDLILPEISVNTSSYTPNIRFNNQ